MPIPNFMAPNINVGATCTNCRHRHEQSTFKRCVKCNALGSKLDTHPFPMHQVDDIEGVE
jgi:hypothetical protein